MLIVEKAISSGLTNWGKGRSDISTSIIQVLSVVTHRRGIRENSCVKEGNSGGKDVFLFRVGFSGLISVVDISKYSKGDRKVMLFFYAKFK